MNVLFIKNTGRAEVRSGSILEHFAFTLSIVSITLISSCVLADTQMDIIAQCENGCITLGNYIVGRRGMECLKSEDLNKELAKYALRRSSLSDLMEPFYDITLLMYTFITSGESYWPKPTKQIHNDELRSIPLHDWVYAFDAILNELNTDTPLYRLKSITFTTFLAQYSRCDFCDKTLASNVYVRAKEDYDRCMLRKTFLQMIEIPNSLTDCFYEEDPEKVKVVEKWLCKKTTF
jgi:hypothetical protein